MAEPDIYTNPRQYRTSVRLLFRFDPDSVSIVRRTRIKKVAPMSAARFPNPDHTGTWLELRGAMDNLIFVRRLVNPFYQIAEVHTKEKVFEIYRRARGTGFFEVVVPEVPGAMAILMSVRLNETGPLEPTRELARFSLQATN